MKKFLSLLLALTMVLSLVVVPARADDETEPTPTPSEATGTITITASKESAVEGDQVTFSVTAPKITYNGTAYDATITSYKWSDNSTGETYTATAGSSDLTATCEVALSCSIPATEEGQEATSVTATATSSKTVSVKSAQEKANEDFKTAITTITYNGRPCTISGDTVTYYTFSGETGTPEWAATAAGYTEVTAAAAGSTLTVSGKNSNETVVMASFTLSAQNFSVTLTPSLTGKKVVVNGTLTVEAACAGVPTDAKYYWSVDSGEAKEGGKTFSVPTDSAKESLSVTCAVKTADGMEIASATLNGIVVVPDTFKFSIDPDKLLLTNLNEEKQITAIFVDTANSNAAVTPDEYSFVSGSPSVVEVKNSNTATPKLVLKTASTAEVKITAKATYLGKDYTLDYIVTTAALSATLKSVENGDYETFTASELKSAAGSALKNAELEGTVESVTLTTGEIKVDNTKVASLETSSSGYKFTAEKGAVTTASITGTVTTKNPTATYTMTFTVSITPIEASFADQYPLPESYNNGKAYRYAVEVPSGYSSFYVVSMNASKAPSDWSTVKDNKTYTGKSGSILYLYDKDFKDGKCTLYIVAFTKAGTAYCGSLTVYQENYDIEYTGVAGESVKFSKDDFTEFLNNVADNTSTSWYVFDHVKFSTFNSKSQGVLYYGSNAMGTSSSSAFKSSTKITDLDSMSFAIADKTTAKQIVVNFTLYADQYRTVSGKDKKITEDVAFTGRVMINVVREDIKLTVAPGSSVTLSATDFLTYLNSNNSYKKSSVDYVTFNVDEITPAYLGLLRTSNGSYYYGTTVKDTDKFYFSPTKTQYGISDVQFQAATTAFVSLGSTVYVPFTIKVAKSNALVEGTLAIEIVQPVSFTDVKSADYCYDAVQWAVNKGITKGTSTTTFSPNDSCTRAQIVTFLWRAAGSPTPSKTTTSFKDVTAAHKDYATAIAWASEKGITTGTSATTFSPDDSCTRAQIVTFLYRYAGKPAASGTLSFSDVSKTTHADYYSAILWATRNGITSGMTPTTFEPNTTCTRGHAVTFLYRYMGQ